MDSSLYEHTHMNRPVTTNKGKYTPHDSNTKAQSLALPATHVDERREDLFSIALRS
jgi:hypothetical protein